jgi:transposase InsO family protein
MDAYSRLIIGWSIAEHMRTELVTDALGMAILRRQPHKRADDEQTILHSDHGSQYQCRSVKRSWACRGPGVDRRVRIYVLAS